METHILDYALYIALFLFITTILQFLAQKISFPYTVALLILGFLMQLFVYLFHFDLPFHLSPDLTYFVLLPVLLFEAAMHINIHQFKLQFKTITFISTFGLLLSIFVVGFGLAYLLHLPFGIALLFGAIISATDPIAVLALFKTLGAPKRLSLVADGESMFNDATAVIAFRVISGFVVAEEAFGSSAVFASAGNFLYVFLGSIILGLLLGYIFSLLIDFFKKDRILITALLTSLALGSFSGAEHFFHLSGVMTTVIAGVVFGNLARGRIKSETTHFVEEYFSYIGFIALSLVFFFASFDINISLFSNELPTLFLVVFVVLLARVVSVYVTFYLSNKLPFFKNEPNVPLSWQHILTWGGLRGVIPLVLVYSLPESFVYKGLMLQFTLATLLFTLFVNGLTIKWLLVKLKLHLPQKEESLLQDEMTLVALNESRKKLQHLPVREFTPSVLKEVENNLYSKETQSKHRLIEMSNSSYFLTAMKLQSLTIERETLKKLFEGGRMTAQVFYEFESELDLQQDALEYPDLANRDIKDGKIATKKPFRKRLLLLRKFVSRYRFLSNMLHVTTEDLVAERFSLLRARLFTSYAVIDNLTWLKAEFNRYPKVIEAINEVEIIQKEYIKRNRIQIQEISSDYPKIAINYQKRVITQLINN